MRRSWCSAFAARLFLSCFAPLSTVQAGGAFMLPSGPVEESRAPRRSRCNDSWVTEAVQVKRCDARRRKNGNVIGRRP